MTDMKRLARRTLRARQKREAKVAALVGAKGGTTKSATTAGAAFVFAERGYRVLLVDLDPQATLTMRCGFARPDEPLHEPPVTVPYLRPTEDGASHEELAVAGSVTLFRGGRSLEAASAFEIAAHIGRAVQWARESDLDFVLVDTPPALGPITHAAMRAADLILVPSELTRDAFDGAVDVVDLHANLQLTGAIRFVATRVDGRMRELNARIRDDVDQLGLQAGNRDLRLTAEIPVSRAAAEASSHSLPVGATSWYDEASKAYRKLVEQMAETLGVPIRKRRAPAAPVPCAFAGDVEVAR